MRSRRSSFVVALAIAGLLAISVVVSATTSAQPGMVGGAKTVNDDVHLNQIQVVGSHNSYHQVPPPEEVAIRRSFIADGDNLLEYQHAPLPVQFESQKVRQIELDTYLDPAGGKYANPLLRQVAGLGPYDPAMDQPGIKVLHVQDVDYHSSCLSLKACLGEVKTWSDANPAHVPIAILIELEDDEVPISGFPFVVPDSWETAAAMNSLDAEIRSVMDPSDLITPDDVRGSHPTLDEAVTTDGWPTLGASRGKVMFLMDNGGGYRSTYLAGHPNLEGRVLFTNANPGDPDAAFVKRNDSSDPSIPGLVRDGYVVRTRADSETVEARDDDTSKRDAGLASGAQWVSTDYPVPNYGVGFDTDYFVEIPGGTVARCNPVNAPPGCMSSQLESPVVPPPPPPQPGSGSTLPPATTTTTGPATTTTAPTTTTSTTSSVPTTGSTTTTGPPTVEPVPPGVSPPGVAPADARPTPVPARPLTGTALYTG